MVPFAALRVTIAFDLSATPFFSPRFPQAS
jgi:hypothetical protein